MAKAADDDEIRDVIAANLAATHFGDLLRAEGQSIIALEGKRIVRTDPDGTRAELGIDRQVHAALQRQRGRAVDHRARLGIHPGGARVRDHQRPHPRLVAGEQAAAEHAVAQAQLRAVREIRPGPCSRRPGVQGAGSQLRRGAGSHRGRPGDIQGDRVMTGSDDNAAMSMKAALLMSLPLLIGALLATAAIASLIAASGHWVLFWILMGLDAYMLIAIPFAVRDARRNRQERTGTTNS